MRPPNRRQLIQEPKRYHVNWNAEINKNIDGEERAEQQQGENSAIAFENPPPRREDQQRLLDHSVVGVDE